MKIRYPAASTMLSEARIYAQESYKHTMDYKGWDDQSIKLQRLTYGTFGQLWVGEFCRLNSIQFKNDRSSPTVADTFDLTICGKSFDIKTSINSSFIGQVSPGVIKKQIDYYGLLLTDYNCSFVEPRGFISKSDYVSTAIEIKEGETIPGTNYVQRFSKSYFLHPQQRVTPFVQFLVNLRDSCRQKRQFAVAT